MSTSPDTLECGHSLAELSSYLDTGAFSDPAHLETCPECQSGLATLRRLSGFAGELVHADVAEAGSGADDWMQSILSNLRLELRPGRTIPLTSDNPADVLSETEGAVTALIRSVVDAIPGTAAGKCHLLGDVTDPEAEITVTVDIAVVYGHHLEERATQVREALAEALRTQTEMNITGIDVTITDVLDPGPDFGNPREEQS
ncbi:Asp23/Gls24 family envelope stress response protein [Paenarthrobacter sp. NPDC089989]|uniref:Asp23/Gls24 family envelope stress response protein n=1 Tax=unclassified Paenarthrobacter TaxID=2634190 RepID=UPI00381BDCCF